jgi:hypothetical protein
MQFIEVTEFAGVRSARLTLRSTASRLEFVLFPMVHLGEQRFYDEVTEHLHACDLVIAERAGIAPGHPARCLPLSYRLAAGTERLGLVVQDIDLEGLQGLGIPVIVPDIEPEEFERGWTRVPLFDAIALPAAAVGFGAWMRWFGTRRQLAESLERNDLPTLDDLEVADRWEAVVELIVDTRDRILTERIRMLHEERRDEALRVAVVWGAEHMRAVVQALHALRYRVTDGDWMTVFLLDH